MNLFRDYKQVYIEQNGKAGKAFFNTVIDNFFTYDNKLRNLVLLVAILVEEKNTKNIQKFITSAKREHNHTKFDGWVSYFSDVVEFKKFILKELCNVLTHDEEQSRWEIFAHKCFDQMEKYVAEFSRKDLSDRNVYSLIHELLTVARDFPDFSYLNNEELFDDYMKKIAVHAINVALDKTTESVIKECKFKDLYSSTKIANIDKILESAIVSKISLTADANKISALLEISTHANAARQRAVKLGWF